MFSTKTIPFKLKNRNNYRTIDKYHLLTTNLKTLLRISIKKKKKKKLIDLSIPRYLDYRFSIKPGSTGYVIVYDWATSRGLITVTNECLHSTHR